MIDIAVHTPRKTLFNPNAVQRAVAAVMDASYCVGRLMPVIYCGRIVAWVGWSFLENKSVAIEHKPWMETEIDRFGFLMGFPTIDALISAVTTSGNLKQTWWHKRSFNATVTFNWMHWYGVDGWPSAGVWSGTAFTARQHDDTEAGSFYHGGNVSTATKHLISGFVATESTSIADTSVSCLYDMVLSYDQCTIPNTLTNFTNTLPGLRYVGSSLPGMQIMGVINSITGSTQYSAMTYTAADGTTGVSVPNMSAIQQNSNGTAITTGYAPPSCFSYPNGNARGILSLPLKTGDSGVRKLESLTMAASATDQHNYILGFQLAWFAAHTGQGYTYPYDLVKQIPSVPRIYDGACLTFASVTSGTTQALNGGFNFAWN